MVQRQKGGPCHKMLFNLSFGIFNKSSVHDTASKIKKPPFFNSMPFLMHKKQKPPKEILVSHLTATQAMCKKACVGCILIWLSDRTLNLRLNAELLHYPSFPRPLALSNPPYHSPLRAKGEPRPQLCRRKCGPATKLAALSCAASRPSRRLPVLSFVQ